MKQNEKEALELKLQSLGFPATLVYDVSQFPEIRDALLPITYRTNYDDDRVNYTVYVTKDSKTGQYRIPRFELALRKPLIIPEKVVHGIDLKALEKDFAQTLWEEITPNLSERKKELLAVLKHLTTNNHPVGIEASEKLAMKYLEHTPIADYVPGIDDLRVKYEIKRSFDTTTPLSFNAQQAYNLMAGRPVGLSLSKKGEHSTFWFQINDLAKDMAEIPLIEYLPGSEYFNLETELLKMSQLILRDEEEKNNTISNLTSGNIALVQFQSPTGNILRLLVADPGNGKVKYAWNEMIRLGMEEKSDFKMEMYRMPNEEEANVQHLLSALSLLGFDEEQLERPIREGVFFHEPHFEVSQRKEYGNDIVNFTIHLDRLPEKDVYNIPRFTAALRKEVLIREAVINGINTKELMRKFEDIDWHAKDYFSSVEWSERLLDLVEGPKQTNIDALLADLLKIGMASPEMQVLFELKFLADTPNEMYCKKLLNAKQGLEIRCEFDLNSIFELNTENAYHLLNGRVLDFPMPYEGNYYFRIPGCIRMLEGPENNHIQWLFGMTEESMNDLFQHIAILNPVHLPKDLEFIKILQMGLSVRIPMIENGRVMEREVLYNMANLRLQFLPKKPETPRSLDQEVYAGDDILRQLRNIGFAGSEKYVLRNLYNGISSFELDKNASYGADRMHFKLSIAPSPEDGKLTLTSLDASLLKEIIIPEIQLSNINTGILEVEMSKIPWETQDYWQMGNDFNAISLPGSKSHFTTAGDIFKDLDILFKSNDPTAKWTAEALATKYLRFTPNEYFLNERLNIEYPYVINWKLNLDQFPGITLDKVHNLMEGRSIYLRDTPNLSEEWVKLRFSPYEDQNHKLEKFIVEDSFDIPQILIDLSMDKQYLVSALRDFSKGDLVTFSALYDNQYYPITVYADRYNDQLKIKNLDVTTELGKYLSEGNKWVIDNLGKREFGQLRDYDIHPLPIFNEELFIELKSRMDLLGFESGHEKELLYKINSYYPEFSIVHNQIFDQDHTQAILHFGPDQRGDAGTGHVDMRGYDFTLIGNQNYQQIQFFIDLYPDLNVQPIFNLAESFQLAKERFVYKEAPAIKEEIAGHWYGINPERQQGSDEMNIKSFYFPIGELKNILSTLPFPELGNPHPLYLQLEALKKGEALQVTYVTQELQIPGFIFVHPQKRAVEFTMSENWKGKTFSCHPSFLISEDEIKKLKERLDPEKDGFRTYKRGGY